MVDLTSFDALVCQALKLFLGRRRSWRRYEFLPQARMRRSTRVRYETLPLADVPSRPHARYELLPQATMPHEEFERVPLIPAAPVPAPGEPLPEALRGPVSRALSTCLGLSDHEWPYEIMPDLDMARDFARLLAGYWEGRLADAAGDVDAGQVRGQREALRRLDAETGRSLTWEVMCMTAEPPHDHDAARVMQGMRVQTAREAYLVWSTLIVSRMEQDIDEYHIALVVQEVTGVGLPYGDRH